jgi:NaMN:DMB phosphoribosyltransferase
VLLGMRIRTSAALFAAHRQFDAWTAPVRDAVIVVQLAVAVAAACAGLPFLLAVVICGIAVAVATQLNPSHTIATSTPSTSTIERKGPR